MNAALLLLLGATAAPAAAEVQGDLQKLVLAQVNGEAITVERLVEDFRTRHGGHLSLLVGADVVRSFLDAVVEDRLLIQEGRRLGLDRDPRVVEEMLRRERALRTEALLQEEVAQRAQVADEEIAAARQKLTMAYRIRLLEVPTLALAEAARARVAGGEAFEDVARELSIDPSARSGGDPGPFVWGGQSLELERQVEALQAGEMSQAFAVGDDFALVMVLDREQLAEPPSGDRVERQIRTILRDRAEARLREALLADLAKQAKVAVHDDLLTVERMRAAARGEGEDAVAASIGRREIRLHDLAANLEFEPWAELPPERFTRQIRRELQGMIDAMLLDDEGRRRHAGGPQVELELQAAADRAVLQRVMGDLVYAKLEPSEEQVRALFDADPARFRSPDRYHVQHLVVADAARAEELRQQLAGQGREAFEEAARQHSLDGDSAPYGGDLGWMRADRVSGPMASALRDLDAGELGPVVPTGVGYVLVRMVERTASEQPPFERARDEVRRAWIVGAQRAARTRWVDRLRAEAVVQVDEPALARAVREMEAKAGAGYAQAGGGTPQPGHP